MTPPGRLTRGDLVRVTGSGLAWVDTPHAEFELLESDEVGLVLEVGTVVGDVDFCRVLFDRLGVRWTTESTLELVSRRCR